MSTAEKALAKTGDAKTPKRSAANQNKVNVGGYERYASAVGGHALALYGLSRKSVPGLLLAGLGGALLYRDAGGVPGAQSTERSTLRR